MSRLEYNVIIDFDDVIYPFCQGIYAVLANEGIYGTITRWDLEKDFGMERGDFWRLVNEDRHLETLYMQHCREDVLRPLRTLRYYGHRLHIVTARQTPMSEHFCREVIRRDNIPFDSLTFTKDKGPMVDELKASFSLDDGPHNYAALDQPGHLAFLMDAPHNQGYVARRVHNVNQFASIVLGYQEAGVQVGQDWSHAA